METKTADATLSTRTLLWIISITIEVKEDDHDQFENDKRKKRRKNLENNLRKKSKRKKKRLDESRREKNSRREKRKILDEAREGKNLEKDLRSGKNRDLKKEKNSIQLEEEKIWRTI